VKRILIALVLAAMPCAVLAWGETGHAWISRVAAENLPDTLPSFLRTPDAVDEIAYLGPEEDRVKGAGTSWNDDNDPGHFLDVDDDFTVAGVVKLDDLPPSMAAYASALAKAGTDPYKQGFVAYTIMDGFERIRKDLALWRVADYLTTNAKTDDAKAQFAKERTLREALTIRDIGDWSHFVGDGSQPLHISIHFNGWGDYPNPNGYSTSRRLHSFFETQFVTEHLSIDDVRKHLAPYAASNPKKLLSQHDIALIVGGYLRGTAGNVPKLCELEKDGAFTQATPEATDFTAAQLGRGATMLRDLIGLAWEDSLNESVGYPAIPVRDVLDGKVVPSGAND
jgi:hypothetical protein